jgi:hypothetical protein
MPLNTTISAEIRATLVGASDHGSPQSVEDLAFAALLASGTGTGQADKIFSDKRTIAASGTDTLDLTALTDPLGAALAFAKVKAIMIRAAPGNTNNVVIGAAASNPFLASLGGTTPTITLKPGDMALLFSQAGWPVTDSSNDQLKLANSAGGTGVDYDTIIIGTSA